jgi:hypothetical protein
MESHLGSRNAEEANRHEHPINSNLVISKLDPIEVLNAKTVGGDQAIQSQDLVHLDGRNQRTPALPDNVRD